MSNLAREIKQKRPFGSPRQEAVLSLYRTTDVIRRRMSEQIERFGITMQQYNVLRILRGAGPDGLPSQEIGKRLIEHSPGITRMIDRLAIKGLVCRDRCLEDRRIVTCTITTEGMDLLERMDEPVQTLDDQTLGEISDRDVKQLMRILDAIRKHNLESD